MLSQALSRRFPIAALLVLLGCTDNAPETKRPNPADTSPPVDTDTDTDTVDDTGDTGDTGDTTEWPAAPLVLDNVSLVDAAGVRPDQALVLVGHEIWSVMDAGSDWPDDADVRDLSGKTVIPGLIDAHVHLFLSGSTYWVGETLSDNLTAQLAWGITGVADLGAPVEIYPLRDQIAAGERIGPRIWATGPFLTATGAHPCESVADSSQCYFIDQELTPTEVVDSLAASDGLKVALADAGFTDWPTPRLDLGDLAEIIAAAGDKPVWVHVDEPDDLSDAHAAGAAVMAHPIFSEAVETYPDVVTTTTFGAFSNPDALFDRSLFAEDLSWTPTVVQDAWAWAADNPDAFLDGFIEANTAWGEAATANLGTALGDGRTVLPGSDAGHLFVPHGVSLHRELEALVAAGMSPVEAITAATATNASALGWDDLGHLAAGYRADLVVLSADPSTDIRATRAIESVWIAGEALDLSESRSPGRAADGFCLSNRDCVTGQRCDLVDHTCRESCAEPYAISGECGVDTFCMPVDALPLTAAGVCHPEDDCDLYDQDCAPAYYGDNCSPIDADSNVCVASGPRQVGQTCSYSDPTLACQQGLFCSWITARCYELCEPGSGTAGCNCVQQYTDDSRPWFGLCL